MSRRAVSHRSVLQHRHEVFRIYSELQQSGRSEVAGLILQPIIPGNFSPLSRRELYPSRMPKLGHLHVREEIEARKSRSLVTVADCPPERACWSCGEKSNCSTVHQLQLLCDAGCGAVQPIDCDSDINLYELFGCPIGVVIDDSNLDTAFLSLQKKLHPDKFASRGAKHQEVSGQMSSMVNMAYQTMKNPVKRVQYLFKLLGIVDVLDEGESTVPPEPDLLNEIFEAREKLENCKTIHEVHSIQKLNHAKIREVLEELQGAFIRKDYEKLAKGGIRLQYFFRVQDDASSKMYSFQ
eukprot:502981_1